jgi:hypothetical protein
MRCPVCRATTDAADQCRRCRADLTLARRVEDERSHLLATARAQLAAVRFANRPTMAAMVSATPVPAAGRTQLVGAAPWPGQVVVVDVGSHTAAATVPAAEAAPVLDAAERAHRLRPDAETARLLAVTYLLRGDFPQAWTYYRQHVAASARPAVAR